MIGGGVENAANGMSYQANLLAYYWNDDAAEMAAADGLKVSQHSYGLITGWRYSNDAGGWNWYWAVDNISKTEVLSYELLLNAAPVEGGSVSDGGVYSAGEAVQLTANHPSCFLRDKLCMSKILSWLG